MLTIYHNPRCSKSRQTLALLQERGFEPDIVKYLQTPPDVATLRAIIQSLGKRPHEIMRKGEADYKALGLADAELSDEQLLQTLHDYPKLIERPIVVSDRGAAIGRPPENVLDIL